MRPSSSIMALCLNVVIMGWGLSQGTLAQVSTESWRRHRTSTDISQSVGLQLDYLSGNSEAITVKPSYRIDFGTPVGDSFVVANLQYGNRSGSNVVNQGLVHWRTSHPLTDQSYAELFFQKEYNDFRLVNDRFLTGLSYRYVWTDFPGATGLRIATGIGIMNEREIENKTTTTEQLRLSTYTAITFIDGDSTLSSATYVQPSCVDAADFRVLSDNQFSVQIRPNVIVKWSGILLYDNRPAPGVKRLDIAISNGVSLTF